MLNYSDLKTEQLAAIDRLYEFDETLLIAGLGFGKAVVGLTALTELVKAGVLKRVLVTAPLRVCTATWSDEIVKWRHLDAGEVAIACGGRANRAAAMKSDARIIVVNFESAVALLDEWPSAFDGWLCDELTKLKASGGVTFKVLRKWTKTLKWRCGMTATPVAEFGGDIYGQALLLDKGKALGTRKDKFLDTYFVPLDYKGYDWVMRKGAAEAISAKLSRLIFRADDSAYLNSLPKLTEEAYPVELTKEALELYRAMAKDSVAGDVAAVNAAVQAGKLAQIAAGGLYGMDDQGLVWVCSEQRRMNALKELVAGIGEPVIITYTYTFQLDALTKLYPNAPVLGGKGDVSKDDIDAFNRGRVPVLLGHPKSMAMGLNLQGSCRVIIHLSPLYSADLYKQSVGRIHRRGQYKVCRRISFYAPNTVEERIISNLQRKSEDEKDFMQVLK